MMPAVVMMPIAITPAPATLLARRINRSKKVADDGDGGDKECSDQREGTGVNPPV